MAKNQKEPVSDTFKINGEDYICEFILYNSAHPGGKKDPRAVHLSKSALKSLIIEENLFEPFVSATAMINNPADMLDNNLLTKGDGTDRFYVSFHAQENPKISGIQDPNQPDKEKSIVQAAEIKVEYEFVITDEVNSTGDVDRFSNYKIYNLVDENYHKLNSIDLPSTMVEGFAGQPVGEVIKKILKENLNEDIIDDENENWEPGNNLAFTTAAEAEILKGLYSREFRASDVIKYLLGIYYKDEEGTAVQGILHYNRLAEDTVNGFTLKKNKFSLRSLSKIFSDHSKQQTEVFAVGELAGDGTSAGANINNPYLYMKKMISNMTQGQLPNTSLSTPMADYKNTYFINYSVRSVDDKGGMIISEQVNIADMREPWWRIFVKPFEPIGGKAVPFLPTGENTAYHILKYPWKPEVNKKLAQAHMMSNFTFLNLQLGFTNLGFTRRTCSQFIDVYRPSGSPQIKRANPKTGKVDDIPGLVDTKLLGTWFVTNCRHELRGERYLNAIQCVKTYVGPDAAKELESISKPTSPSAGVSKPPQKESNTKQKESNTKTENLTQKWGPNPR